jgi:hypothetical protein
MMLDTFKNFTVFRLCVPALWRCTSSTHGALQVDVADRVWLGHTMPHHQIHGRNQFLGFRYQVWISKKKCLSRPTVGRLGQPLEDDAYTTILVKECVEMSIQASYELRMFPDKNGRS